MDEIELLRQFRADFPGAEDGRRQAARAALLERAGGDVARVRRGRIWRSRRARVAVAALGSAAIAIALPLAVLDGGGRVESAAAQALNRAAEVAAAQEPTTPGPGQFLFVRSKSAYLRGTGNWSVLVPTVREVWLSFDGSRNGRVREVAGEARFVSADQRARWLAAGSPPLPRAGQVEDSPASGGTLIDGSDLPTDPEELRERIEAREIPGVEGPPGEAETFALIGDMLRETYLPSALRAALFEAAAELPEIELLGEVRDPVGRPGTAVAFTDRRRHHRHELIFDPRTSGLLGERFSLVGSEVFGFEAPPGTQIGYAAYLESRIVDSVGRGAPPGAGAPDTTVSCYDRPALDANVTIVHGADPVATCAKLWREGVVDTRRGPSSPPLVACVGEDGSVPAVFPGEPPVCRRLGLVAATPAKLP